MAKVDFFWSSCWLEREVDLSLSLIELMVSSRPRVAEVEVFLSLRMSVVLSCLSTVDTIGSFVLSKVADTVPFKSYRVVAVDPESGSLVKTTSTFFGPLAFAPLFEGSKTPDPLLGVKRETERYLDAFGNSPRPTLSKTEELKPEAVSEALDVEFR